MSKMDGLRAMREARYTKATTGTAARTREALEALETTPATQGLCGHRAISGRTCTREHGHAAKSHRYA